MAGKAFAVPANLLWPATGSRVEQNLFTTPCVLRSIQPWPPGYLGQPPPEAMTHFATTTDPRSHRPRLYRYGIAALCAWSLLLAPRLKSLLAEEPAAKPANTPVASANEATVPKGPIQYVGPDTYILLDAQGRPQPVPGMTYEDFLAAWKKQNNPANVDSQPRFTIESIKVDGQTHGQRADLKLDVTIHLLADGPVNVPLGLVGAILQGDPQFNKVANASTEPATTDSKSPKEKPNDEYLDFDPQHGGFVTRVAGTAGTAPCDR